MGPNRNPRKDLAITPEGVESEMPHYSSTGNSCPKINISERADRTLVLDTGNYALDEITKPAMLLRDRLVDSLDAKRTGANVAISEPQAGHLQMLIDFLVVSAHTASAEALMKRYGYGSETKLLDRGSPSLKIKSPMIRKEQPDYRSITEESMPVYVEKKSMTLDTRIGSVRATILSARTSTDSTTLVFTFEYAGDPGLGLSSFAVNFMSHTLLTTLPPLKWLLTPAEIHTKAMSLLEDEDEVVRWEVIKASVWQSALPRETPTAAVALLGDELNGVRYASIAALARKPVSTTKILTSLAARANYRHRRLARNDSKTVAAAVFDASGLLLCGGTDGPGLQRILYRDILVGELARAYMTKRRIYDQLSPKLTGRLVIRLSQ